MTTHQEGLVEARSFRKPSTSGPGILSRIFFPARPTAIFVAVFLCAFVALGVVLAVIYLSVVKPTYSATLLIGPTQEQFASSPSSQLDRNSLSLLSGGLLSGPRVISPYDAFLKTMQTREVADILFADPEIRQGLFPGTWDEETKSWTPDDSIRSKIASILYRMIGRPYTQIPTSDLSMVERGPMYSMTFASTDRDFAIELLRRAFLTTDAIVKDKNRAQVLQRIEALRARMASLGVVDYRSQFVNLLMDQEKQLMVLQGNTDFAASMIVAPSAPDYPDSPRLFVTIAVFMALLFFLGTSVLTIAYREWIVKRMRPPSVR